MSTKEIIEQIKADSRTTWVAVILGALLAGGEYLQHQAHIEPWGSILTGIAGVGSALCMAFARFGKK